MNTKEKMRNRSVVRRCVIAVAALLLMSVLAFTMRRPTMPSYAGRSAEDWLNVYHDRSGSTSAVAAFDAFRQMGTNGVAFLVESLGRGDNVWSQRVYPWIFRHVPMVVAERLPEPGYPDALASMAQMVLAELTVEKRDSTPERTFTHLVKLLELRDDLRREWVAAVVGQYANTYPQLDLAPFRAELARALNDDYPGVRFLIADASPIAKLLGPALVESSLKPYLTNSEPGLRNAAQEFLFPAGVTNVDVDRTNAP